MTELERMTELEAAVDTLLDMFSGYLGEDIGPAMTCDEAEAVGDLFRARGRNEDADWFVVVAHGRKDEDGDDHYKEDDDDNED